MLFYKVWRICIDGNNSKLEIVNRGLRQGCSLSPILFHACTDDVLREWKSCLPFYNLGFGDYRSAVAVPCFLLTTNVSYPIRTVSYTHLDVYKRQDLRTGKGQY